MSVSEQERIFSLTLPFDPSMHATSDFPTVALPPQPSSWGLSHALNTPTAAEQVRKWRQNVDEKPTDICGTKMCASAASMVFHTMSEAIRHLDKALVTKQKLRSITRTMYQGGHVRNLVERWPEAEHVTTSNTESLSTPRAELTQMLDRLTHIAHSLSGFLPVYDGDSVTSPFELPEPNTIFDHRHWPIWDPSTWDRLTRKAHRVAGPIYPGLQAPSGQSALHSVSDGVVEGTCLVAQFRRDVALLARSARAFYSHLGEETISTMVQKLEARRARSVQQGWSQGTMEGYTSWANTGRTLAGVPEETE